MGRAMGRNLRGATRAASVIAWLLVGLSCAGAARAAEAGVEAPATPPALITAGPVEPDERAGATRGRSEEAEGCLSEGGPIRRAEVAVLNHGPSRGGGVQRGADLRGPFRGDRVEEADPMRWSGCGRSEGAERKGPIQRDGAEGADPRGPIRRSQSMWSICVGRSELADLWRPVQVGRSVRDDPRSPIRVGLRRSRSEVAERKRPTRYGFSAGPSRRGRSKGFNPRGHFQWGWSKMVDPTVAEPSGAEPRGCKVHPMAKAN